MLTSDTRVAGKPAVEAGIFRCLPTEVDLRPYRAYLDFFFYRKRRLQETLHRFQEVLTRFHPDVLFVWGMWNLPRELLALAESWPGLSVAYYIADYWPALPTAYTLHFQEKPRSGYARIPKQILSRIALSMEQKRRPVSLKFEHVFCVSQAVRRRLEAQPSKAGLPFSHARVIYNGIDRAPFIEAGKLLEQHPLHSPPALLYAGRIAPDKGVWTALEAVALLKKASRPVTLTLFGTGAAEFVGELRRLSASLGIAGQVIFEGFIPRQQMPQTLSRFDLLVFPSTWPEPLARIVQEAMAAGLVVVGTDVGGMPEILVDGVNGLVFPSGNAQELARCIERLTGDEALRRQLAKAGRKMVEERFDIQRMVDEMEDQLLVIVDRKDENIISIPVVPVSTQ